MIQDQCNNCKKYGTDNCGQSIVFNSRPCEYYMKKIDLSKPNGGNTTSSNPTPTPNPQPRPNPTPNYGGGTSTGSGNNYGGGTNGYNGSNNYGNNSNGYNGSNNHGYSNGITQMSFFDSLLSFSGRSRRSRYWITSFFCSGIMIVLVLLGAILTGGDEGGATFGYILGIIPCFAISLANGTKRLHDLGHNGWMQLLLFIPIVNIGIGIYMAFFEGERHDNQYGPSPY